MAGLSKAEVCVLLPAYNEAARIGELVRRIRAEGFDPVVVDDGSTDRTSEAAREAGAQVLRAEKNKGKGAALRQGFSWFLEQKYRALVMMDSDGQHDPAELGKFVTGLGQGRCGLLVGDRMAESRCMPLVRRLTNRAMSALISFFAKQPIPDTQCGYRAATRETLARLSFTAENFEIETEMLLEAARKGVEIGSLPVRCLYGDEKSRIHPVRDTWRFFKFLATHRHLL